MGVSESASSPSSPSSPAEVVAVENEPSPTDNEVEILPELGRESRMVLTISKHTALLLVSVICMLGVSG